VTVEQLCNRLDDFVNAVERIAAAVERFAAVAEADVYGEQEEEE
jgi:hypothetical protein